MSVVLFRVDERLIHGQVVVGWGRRLHPDRIVVVHDELARAPVEQEIYRTGLPEDVEAVFWTEREAADRLDEVDEASDRTFVLTEDLATMTRLVHAGAPIETVNVGGLHAAPGRDAILPFVHLSSRDTDRIRALEAEGIEVLARDVPTAEAVRLVDRLA